MIEIYTDGACKSNPGPAGAGIYIEYPDGLREEISAPLGQGTNNIAELTALKIAFERLLEIIKNNTITVPTCVKFYSDSEYAIKGITRVNKARKNVELVKATAALYDEIQLKVEQAEIRWVRGHANNKGNEIADGLASEAKTRKEIYMRTYTAAAETTAAVETKKNKSDQNTTVKVDEPIRPTTTATTAAAVTSTPRKSKSWRKLRLNQKEKSTTTTKKRKRTSKKKNTN